MAKEGRLTTTDMGAAIREKLERVKTEISSHITQYLGELEEEREENVGETHPTWELDDYVDSQTLSVLSWNLLHTVDAELRDLLRDGCSRGTKTRVPDSLLNKPICVHNKGNLTLHITLYFDHEETEYPAPNSVLHKYFYVLEQKWS
jgi:hypothetical protein